MDISKCFLKHMHFSDLDHFPYYYPHYSRCLRSKSSLCLFACIYYACSNICYELVGDGTNQIWNVIIYLSVTSEDCIVIIAPLTFVFFCGSCSICSMKRNTHFIVPNKDFKLVKVSAQLYTKMCIIHS